LKGNQENLNKHPPQNVSLFFATHGIANVL